MKIKAFYIYVIIIFISVSVIGTSAYYLLGGFDEIVVYEMEGESRIVVGRRFIGKPTHRYVNKYFAESRNLILDRAINGTLTVIVNKNDSLKNNEVDYFIGIIIDGEMAEVPIGYQVLEYKSSKRFGVFISMDPLVRPSSRKINQLLKKKADQMNFVLADHTFELHYADDSMSVEAWVD